MAVENRENVSLGLFKAILGVVVVLFLCKQSKSAKKGGFKIF